MNSQKNTTEITFTKFEIEKTTHAAYALETQRATEKFLRADVDTLRNICLCAVESLIEKIALPTDPETFEVTALLCLDNIIDQVKLAEAEPNFEGDN